MTIFQCEYKNKIFETVTHFTSLSVSLLLLQECVVNACLYANERKIEREEREREMKMDGTKMRREEEESTYTR